MIKERILFRAGLLVFGGRRRKGLYDVGHLFFSVGDGEALWDTLPFWFLTKNIPDWVRLKPHTEQV